MKLFVTLWNANGMSYWLIHWRWESDWWGFSGCNQMRRDSFKHAWNINPVISTFAGCWMTWDLATLQSLQPGSKSRSFVNFQAFKMWKTGTHWTCILVPVILWNFATFLLPFATIAHLWHPPFEWTYRGPVVASAGRDLRCIWRSWAISLKIQRTEQRDKKAPMVWEQGHGGDKDR